MGKLIILVVIALTVLVTGAYFVFNNQNQNSNTSTQSQTPTQAQEAFTNPKKAAHWQSNTPNHADVLAAAPINIVINFDFDLAQNSEINIQKDGQDYGLGQTRIDENSLTMRRDMNPDAPDGIYTVAYNACWADGSCHDGSFQFEIDNSQSSKFEDMTGQTEVTVELANLSFNPINIKVSKGTTVTWINKDSVIHTINTDSHPAHTYFPDQNSRDLEVNGKYSVIFEKPGVYPYHCTPHADTMTGQILVI